MSSSSFEFKQFIIKQDKCAMKVGTDAVLLGSWATANGSRFILDIGTGTGIIAMMLAQKTKAHIDAIDIDELACIQATQNVSQSKFSGRVEVMHLSLQQFAKNTQKKYDLIITNPPYFEQSLKSSDEQRSYARHADVLPFDELIDGVVKLLDEKGKLCLILPTLEAEKFRVLAKKKGLFLSKLLRVKSKENNQSEKRCLMQYEFTPTEFSEQTIAIEKGERHQYTTDYIELTKDYYLNF